MPANKKLLVLPGDGIGPEVMREVRRVVDWMDRRRHVTFSIGTAGIPSDWREHIGDEIVTISLNNADRHFDKTCTELTDHVCALIPAVLRATTTNDKAGALNTEVKQEPDTPNEQNAIIPFTSLSLSSENDVNEGMDQANMKQEGNEQNMSPHTLILLEQVRVARRGYAKAEAELAIEDNIIAHAGAAAMVEAGQAGWRDWVVKKAEMEVWRKRCENSLRELRGVADVNELESVWAGLEAAKRL